jgi:hypothetical protein
MAMLCGTADVDYVFEDPHAAEKAEFFKFKQDIDMMHSMIESFHTELSKLNPLYDEYCRYVRKILTTFPDNSSDSEKLTRLIANSNNKEGGRFAFDESKLEHQAVIDMLGKLRAEMINLENKMKEREKSAKKRHHYQVKVEMLRKKNSESPRYRRNMGKLSQAETEFDDIDSFVVNDLKRFMDHRLETLDIIVGKHHEQIRKYFSSAAIPNASVTKSSGVVEQVPPLSPVSPMIMSPTSPLAPVIPANQSVMKSVYEPTPMKMDETASPSRPTRTEDDDKPLMTPEGVSGSSVE